VSIHDVYWHVFVPKGIESDVEVPAIVNHVEVYVPAILSGLVLAVLDQRVFTGDGDTNKIGLVKKVFSKGHSVNSFYLR